MSIQLFLKHSICACFSLLCTSMLWAQTPNTQALVVKRDASLHRNATEQSEALAQLPAQSRVTAQGQRQGAWVQVKTEQGISGWLQLFQLGQIPSKTTPNQGDSSWVRGFSSWWGNPAPRNTQSVATTTIGIRGLEASDIAKAQPDPAAVTQAENQRVDTAQAQSFAQRNGLQARHVEDLPDTNPRPHAPTKEVLY
jgi:uncharacterized protein YgiM (DUF1202 family)